MQHSVLVHANSLQKEEALVAADVSNGVGWKIFSCLSGSTTRHNLLFSPVSITTTLAVLYYGALGNRSAEIRCEIASLLSPSSSLGLPTGNLCSKGNHKKENKSIATSTNMVEQCYCPPGKYFRSLLTTLQAYNNTNETIDISNGLWHYGRLHSVFKQSMTNYFRPKVMMFDPEKPAITASNINQWVSNKTRGKISEIINAESIRKSDKVYLFNVLYFRALWRNSFTAHKYNKFTTCVACYNVTSNGSVEEVQYMERTQTVPYCRMSSLAAVRIPYSNDNLSMTIILPKLCSMRKVESDLINGDLLQHINNCMTPKKVRIILPKFELKQKLPLHTILSKLGLQSTHSSDGGGFSTILKKDHNLQLSRFSHQSVLEVNEQGIHSDDWPNIGLVM